MLKNTAINRTIIRKIAKALGQMNKQFIYVGGAVVSLYINDPAADDVRPTKDVDICMSIASLGKLEKVREQLINKSFIQTSEDNVICRFRYEDIKVDVMNTKAVGWAPANPWFAPGFKKKESVNVEGESIQILPLPYFLASKFTAFNGRGYKDPRTSNDFEDIIYVLDNRTDIFYQLKNAPKDVKSFLVDQLQGLLNDRVRQEAIYANLLYETREIRYKQIIDGIKSILEEQ